MKPEAKELGLIEASPEPPAPVQGQGNEHHGVFREGPGQGLGHQGGHEPGRLGAAMEFQLLRQHLSAAAVAKGGKGPAGRAPGGSRPPGRGRRVRRQAGQRSSGPGQGRPQSWHWGGRSQRAQASKGFQR